MSDISDTGFVYRVARRPYGWKGGEVRRTALRRALGVSAKGADDLCRRFGLDPTETLEESRRGQPDGDLRINKPKCPARGARTG